MLWSFSEDSCTSEDKYTHGFNSCFNEVLRYISVSESCRPELRAKVLSHLVDKFSQNSGNTTDIKYTDKIIGENKTETVSDLIPKPIKEQSLISPVFDQNNNVEHFSIDENKCLHKNMQTEMGRNQKRNITVGCLTPTQVSVRGTNVTPSQVQMVESDMSSEIAGSRLLSNCCTTQLGSDSVQLVRPADASVTISPTIISKPGGTQMMQTSEQTLSPEATFTSSVHSDMISTPNMTEPVQTPMHFVGSKTSSSAPCHVTSTTQNISSSSKSPEQNFDSSVSQQMSSMNSNGQLTVLVPASVLAFPNFTPAGSTFLLTYGCNSYSPVAVPNSNFQFSPRCIKDTTAVESTIPPLLETKQLNPDADFFKSSEKLSGTVTSNSIALDMCDKNDISLRSGGGSIKSSLCNKFDSRCSPYSSDYSRRSIQAQNAMLNVTGEPDLNNKSFPGDCDFKTLSNTSVCFKTFYTKESSEDEVILPNRCGILPERTDENLYRDTYQGLRKQIDIPAIAEDSDVSKPKLSNVWRPWNH